MSECLRHGLFEGDFCPACRAHCLVHRYRVDGAKCGCTDKEKVRQRKWDQRYVDLARWVGRWSKDPSTKVGAVLVRPNNSVASTGFNGFPPDHDDDPALYADRAYKYANVVHAEENALNFFGSTADGFALYTSFPCCPDCVEKAAAAGVSRIVCPPINTDGRNEEWVYEWKLRIRRSLEVAKRLGIRMEVGGV